MSRNKDYEDRHRPFRVSGVSLRGSRVVLDLVDTGETGRPPITYSLPTEKMDAFLANNELGHGYLALLGRKVVANVRERAGNTSTVTELVGMASQAAL